MTVESTNAQALTTPRSSIFTPVARTTKLRQRRSAPVRRITVESTLGGNDSTFSAQPCTSHLRLSSSFLFLSFLSFSFPASSRFAYLLGRTDPFSSEQRPRARESFHPARQLGQQQLGAVRGTMPGKRKASARCCTRIPSGCEDPVAPVQED